MDKLLNFWPLNYYNSGDTAIRKAGAGDRARAGRQSQVVVKRLAVAVGLEERKKFLGNLTLWVQNCLEVAGERLTFDGVAFQLDTLTNLGISRGPH